MSQPLTIDFVSDIACPWCAIGLSSLQLALARLGDAVDAQIVVHPFELNPQMGPEGEAIVDYLGKKYGRTPEQIAQTQEMIRERGASVGFNFGPRNYVYNTFDAHRLLHWAGLEGKQLPLKLELLRAYHSEGRDPSNHDVLVAAAQAVGLDADAARNVLQSGDYADEVRAEEEEFQSHGIQSVPAIIFNRRYLVSGGQPVETFEQVIQQILAEA
ncbi:DsbA family oxidoreductase [Paraburkholderia strydomiana]|jgi:predicted DsbA family dithiol-disulfide isomerase|uniref:DsbA family dithiol-disulfide isomerase n=2 Tax=Paraburkholderia caledonica TaxID=134536 RepID=A0AB73IGZ4_9BURK|nr:MULTISPECIES: DsbA family oxidoreductase [Paraburkholderia]OWJ62219.1 disulfide bond formation protein DsbA [Burkholderia sp. Bk]MDP9648971.1 putative DsbA family dithiol-disulfide isomerase [Paraburkholderia caledonica]MDR6378108.1 putative DsbA family dithiol-disulfide isomerase [Paraburkholderia caledonica]MDR7005310.1 putative DsbA family dithiol-disulfide isomerase [Paraburkholderia strydomiana]TCG01358.1 disulfide bond formation protein DsbA [Paraburkholderia strydomiana]